jgi:hypothetical protein
VKFNEKGSRYEYPQCAMERGRKGMNKLGVFGICAMVVIALALLPGSAGSQKLVPGSAASQKKPLKDQLVGTWVFVESTGKRPDGSPNWGQNPKGLLVFDASGRYISTILRADIPKYTSDNRLKATPAEEKATVQGSIATVGTYTVDEAERSYTINVEGSTFPNWNGTKQKRTVASITADELKINNPAPSVGGSPTQLVYRRAK